MNVNDISNTLKSLFDIQRQPAPEIPGMLISVGATQKPGLSEIISTSKISAKLEEHLIPTGAMDDGTENKTMVIVRAIVNEVYRALREDAKIQVSYAPGAITVMSSGANAGGPVISQGININFGKGLAVVE